MWQGTHQVRYLAWHTVQSLWQKHRGRPSSFLFLLPWSSFESYSTSHLTTQVRTPSLTDLFWTPSKSCQRCVFFWKYHQASWSICIDLDAQYVSSFIQVFLWKTHFKQPFMLSRNSTSFRINNMSFTYTYQKCCSAPTHFIANTSFQQTLYTQKTLITPSKHIFRLQDACSSP